MKIIQTENVSLIVHRNQIGKFWSFGLLMPHQIKNFSMVWKISSMFTINVKVYVNGIIRPHLNFWENGKKSVFFNPFFSYHDWRILK